MIIPRTLTGHLRQLIQLFPIISVTGPRQAGKTTLLAELFPDYEYISLEALDVREKANQDTLNFLKRYPGKVIFDEAQHAPPLFNYLQGLVDKDPQPGRVILSGSQNFLLHQNITQSLAGRVGVTRLFPFDLEELNAAGRLPSTPESAILNGFYPRQFSFSIAPKYFYPSYISSYLERDVGDLINAKSLKAFLTFLQCCAHFAGQLVNYSRLGQMAGVSRRTVDSWLSILEMSYVIFFVQPYFENFGKRVTKSPKLFFYDTGLLCHLLEIDDTETLKQSRVYGALFENLIVADRKKRLQHLGERDWLYFFRDTNGLEADLLEGGKHNRTLTEIKSGSNVNRFWDKNIRKVAALEPEVPTRFRVVYGGSSEVSHEETSFLPWFEAGRL